VYLQERLNPLVETGKNPLKMPVECEVSIKRPVVSLAGRGFQKGERPIANNLKRAGIEILVWIKEFSSHEEIRREMIERARPCRS